MLFVLFHILYKKDKNAMKIVKINKFKFKNLKITNSLQIQEMLYLKEMIRDAVLKPVTSQIQ